MSPVKKGDRVAPPAEPGRWLLTFANNAAAKGWEDLVRQAPGNVWKAYEAIRTNPRPFPPTGRQHRLKGKDLASINGLEQWQYEVTGGGRIWYLINPGTKTIFVRYAGTGHPKATE